MASSFDCNSLGLPVHFNLCYSMRIKFLFAWYNLWIGFFIDKEKAWIYFLPLPTIGWIFKFLPDGYKIKRVVKIGFDIETVPTDAWLRPGKYDAMLNSVETICYQIFKGEEPYSAPYPTWWGCLRNNWSRIKLYDTLK